jgi:hypothetical protein
MSGVMWDAARSMDVLELLSQLRAALNPLSDETWALVQLIHSSVDADPRSSKVERQIIERLRSEVTDRLAVKGKSSHLSPVFVTISALEASIERRAATGI